MALAGALVAGARVAPAQSGPWPPALGGYFWAGVTQSGNGSTTDWEHAWLGGRWRGEAGSPPTIVWLPAEDGDSLNLNDLFINEEEPQHHTISLGTHFLPSSGLSISVFGDYSGGDLTFSGVGIRNLSAKHGTTNPLVFTGTKFNVDAIDLLADWSSLTFNDVEIDATEATIRGTRWFLDPGSVPQPEVNFNNATLTASVLAVSQLPNSYSEFPVTLTDSNLSVFDFKIGFADNDIDHAAVVRLAATDAMVYLALNIGDDGGGVLRLEHGSQLLSGSTAYANVGVNGAGFLLIADNSEFRIPTLNVGLDAQGDVGIVTGGRLYANEATVGGLPGRDGTVDIQGGTHDSLWDVTDLTVGAAGTGYVYVRDYGVLELRGEGVLGYESGSRGVLNLVGAFSKLQIEPGATLQIGREGAGELHLSEGATFTSQGAVSLGSVAGGSGAVTINGEFGLSQWKVAGNLDVGERSTGRVEVTKGGTLDVQGLGIFLGKQAQGDGTLVIEGRESTVDFSGLLVMGDFGKAHLELKDGAAMTLENLTLASFESSSADIKLIDGQSSDQQLFTVNGEFFVGKAGDAKIDVGNFSTFITKGAVVVAESATSTSEIKVAGSSGVWFTDGGSVTLGRHGNATLSLEQGGRAQIDADLIAGEMTGSTGAIFIKPSDTALGASLSVSAGTTTFGKQGTSSVTVGAGGTLSSSAGAKIVAGAQADGHGTITLQGATGKVAAFNSNGTLILGKGALGTGKVIVKDNATLALAAGASADDEHGTILGYDDDSAGTIEVEQAVLPNPVTYHSGAIVIGRDGTGTFKVRGGHHEAGGTSFYLGLQENGQGTLDLAGDGIELTLNHLIVGSAGDGELLLDNKAKLNAQSVRLGKGSEATIKGAAIATVLGTGFENGGELRIEGGSQLNLPDADFTTAPLALGNVGSTPSVNIQGNGATDEDRSTLTARNIQLGNGLTASMTLGGAHVEASGAFTLASASTVFAGGPSLRLTAANYVLGLDGTATRMDIVQHGEMRATSTAGVYVGPQSTLQAALNATARIANLLEVRGVVNVETGAAMGAARVLIRGQGLIDLKGATQGGSLVVGGDVNNLPSLDPGTLLIRPGGSLQGVSHLAGVTAIKGKVIVGGDLIVGQSPGFLAVDGDVEFQSTGRLFMEIGGATPGTQFDQLQATGGIALGGALDLQVTPGTGFVVPSVGQEFTLLTATGGVSGAFANAAALRSLTSDFRVDWALNLMANQMTAQATKVSLLADFDENGRVERADYVLWRGGAGLAASATHGQGDADGDGDVDGGDFLIWQRQLGLTTASVIAAATVPEPPTVALLVAGCAAAVGARRRPLRPLRHEPHDGAIRRRR
jgi:T5SS/PEP-CTERM-associated repeat protein